MSETETVLPKTNTTQRIMPMTSGVKIHTGEPLLTVSRELLVYNVRASYQDFRDLIHWIRRPLNLMVLPPKLVRLDQDSGARPRPVPGGPAPVGAG